MKRKLENKDLTRTASDIGEIYGALSVLSPKRREIVLEVSTAMEPQGKLPRGWQKKIAEKLGVKSSTIQEQVRDSKHILHDHFFGRMFTKPRNPQEPETITRDNY